MSRKYFNDGDDAPIVIKPGDKRVHDCIPAGSDDNYIKTEDGWIKKEDFKQMQKDNL